MQILDIIVKRESLKLPVNDKLEEWDYLTIYNQNNEVLARSVNAHFESTIDLEYEGFTFVAPPQAKIFGENNIYITVSSIKNEVKKTKVAV